MPFAFRRGTPLPKPPSSVFAVLDDNNGNKIVAHPTCTDLGLSLVRRGDFTYYPLADDLDELTSLHNFIGAVLTAHKKSRNK